MPSQPGRVFGLDAMRAGAALTVVVAHGVPLTSGDFTSPPATHLASVLAVAVFFVLSGYLVGGLLLRAAEAEPTPAGLLRFWVRRWARTLPAYYVMLVANLALLRLVGRAAVTPLAYVTFTQNLSHSVPPSFFVESWSLSVEEWFYLALPLLLFAAAMRRQALVAPVLVALCVVVAIGSCAIRLGALHAVALPDPMAPRIVLLRMDGLLIGACAALWRQRSASGWATIARADVAATGALTIGGACWAVLRPAPALALLACWPVIVSLGVALALPWLTVWRPHPSPLTRATSAAAAMSYSLYLAHAWCVRLLGRLPFAAPGHLGWSLTVIALYATLAVGASHLLYRYVEAPVMAWRDRTLRRPARQPAAVVPAG